MLVDLDVVIEIYSYFAPLHHLVRPLRKRAERGALVLLVEIASGRATEFFHRTRVELFAQLGDPLIEGGEGEERLIAKTRQDPALYDLHPNLDLRLVAWLPRPCRYDRGAIVPRHLTVGALHARLVPVGRRHA